MQDLSFYHSLPVPQYRNKYEVSSHYFNLDYRLITGQIAYTLPLPAQVKQFIMEYEEVVTMPNRFQDQVIGILLRPIYTKTFRYFSEYKTPYGAGINNKPYTLPWVIVESCLDADFLRQYYPYVIATFGVTVSNFLQEFLFETAPYIIVGFDNDEAGLQAYKKMYYKYKGRVKKIEPPLNNKDFGDTLNHLFTNNLIQFELESLLIKTSLQALTGYQC
jgi:hypothetical protein